MPVSAGQRRAGEPRGEKINAGFTLIETLVALLVVAVAYAGITTAVSRFADQRHTLLERHAGHRIAWNRQMEQHLLARGIVVDEAGFAGREGRVTIQGRDWNWRVSGKDAAGEDLVRYQVDVFPLTGGAERPAGSLTAFFTR